MAREQYPRRTKCQADRRGFPWRERVCFEKTARAAGARQPNLRRFAKTACAVAAGAFRHAEHACAVVAQPVHGAKNACAVVVQPVRGAKNACEVAFDLSVLRKNAFAVADRRSRFFKKRLGGRRTCLSA